MLAGHPTYFLLGFSAALAPKFPPTPSSRLSFDAPLWLWIFLGFRGRGNFKSRSLAQRCADARRRKFRGVPVGRRRRQAWYLFSKKKDQNRRSKRDIEPPRQRVWIPGRGFATGLLCAFFRAPHHASSVPGGPERWQSRYLLRRRRTGISAASQRLTHLDCIPHRNIRAR